MIPKHAACVAEAGRCGSCCTKIENFGVMSGKTVILDNVNLHIHCGELTAIIGPNGAGKSTLLKAVLGEIRHTGQLRFLSCGGDSTKSPVFGYVPQQLEFDSSSPASVMDLFAACRTSLPVWFNKSKKVRGRIMESLENVKAGHLADRRLGDLSGGELQRVMLALALDPVPDILLLDEPVSGVDLKGMALFYDTVSELRRKYDLSIILVSHDFTLVDKYADRVVLLDKTVKCVGTPGEVFTSRQACDLFGPFSGKSSEESQNDQTGEGLS